MSEKTIRAIADYHPIEPNTQRGDAFASERSDCTVAATAIAAQIPYYEAHKLLAEFGRKSRHPVRYTAFISWLKGLALPVGKYHVERVQMPSCLPANRLRAFGPFTQSVTLAQFLRDFPKGRFVVRISGHVFAVIDGVQYDGSPNGSRCKITDIYHFRSIVG